MRAAPGFSRNHLLLHRNRYVVTTECAERLNPFRLQLTSELPNFLRRYDGSVAYPFVGTACSCINIEYTINYFIINEFRLFFQPLLLPGRIPGAAPAHNGAEVPWCVSFLTDHSIITHKGPSSRGSDSSSKSYLLSTYDRSATTEYETDFCHCIFFFPIPFCCKKMRIDLCFVNRKHSFRMQLCPVWHKDAVIAEIFAWSRQE